MRHYFHLPGLAHQTITLMKIQFRKIWKLFITVSLHKGIVLYIYIYKIIQELESNRWYFITYWFLWIHSVQTPWSWWTSFPYCSVICHNIAAQEQHHVNKFILKRVLHFLSPYSAKIHPTVMPIYKYWTQINVYMKWCNLTFPLLAIRKIKNYQQNC